jgi:hypothetical protein
MGGLVAVAFAGLAVATPAVRFLARRLPAAALATVESVTESV